ncbi:pepsin-like aspartic protease [Marinomonas sp. RSW2]|uniref:Pepsin-like aspartic protease n=1 Tax=Marinomonas maritima TaxID=2940935 RepID=A0ABT5WGK4_9GAMM|nr:pepsin-like aspartic protease [Marinomonas maritima]MDE8602776.1 pepsin-like aspartic protease [Marinomonas maritima]
MKSVLMKSGGVGLSVSLNRGPYQNNGASPWYAFVGVGTPAQTLKFSFDTGSNFIWATSSLCHPETCHHYGDQQFVYQISSSFSWVNQHTTDVNFGPWGNMDVKTGNDVFTLTPESLGRMENGSVSLSSDLYLAESYQGTQFRELDWDGGIGIPSTNDRSDFSSLGQPYRGMTPQRGSEAASFHFFQSLVEQGIVSAKRPYVTFLTDIDSESGQVEFGQLNQDYRDSREYLFLPWQSYSIPSVSYIWTSQLTSLSVGDKVLIHEGKSLTPYFFSLDSGSSQFKGDPKIMNEVFSLTSKNGQDVIIELGKTDRNENGRLVVPSSIYDVLIEHGEDRGKTISQFSPLDGLDNLVLVGSVLMDYLYTVYEYEIISFGSESRIKPVGMWIFNKLNGPKIITSTQGKPAKIFHIL